MRQHVYLSSNFWDGLWIIQQPTCHEIQRREPVLYVERFVSLFTVLRYPGLWPRLFTWMLGPRRRGPRLRLLAPLPLFHLGHRFPRLFRLEFALQRLWIRLWAGPPPAGGRVLWMDNPMYACAPGTMGETLAVYHVADETSAFPTSHAETMARLEADMLGRVQLVFAAAQQLRDHKARLNPHAYTVWNAIDAGVFATEPDPDTFADLEAVPAPRVIFVGVLDQWCDLELLEAAARALPRVGMVFVGPVRVEAGALAALPNVHFLGRRDRAAVPGFLRRCAASLVIFRRIPLTERIVPLKIFEALAAGIMPVCTPFSPDLAALEASGLVRLAATAPELAAQVEAAIAADTPAERERLSAWGLRQTWAERWREMSELIDRRIAGLAAGPADAVPAHF